MVQLEDYGIETGKDADPETNIEALEAAYSDADDYIRAPEGFIPVRAPGTQAVRIQGEKTGVMMEGAGPEKTRFWMGPDHNQNQNFAKFEEGENHDGAGFRNLTLDGNGRNQNDVPAFGCSIQAEGNHDMLFENVRFFDWGTNGINSTAGGWTARHCSFIKNGLGEVVVEDGDGHGIGVNNDAGTTVLVDRCYFTGMSGTAVDVQDTHAGLVHLRKSLIEDTQYGCKLNPGSGVFHIDNCHFRNLGVKGIYYIPSDKFIGTLRITQTRIENVVEEGLYFACPVNIEGGDFVLVNANAADDGIGPWHQRNEMRVDMGRISLHDSKHECALEWNGVAEGTIDKIVHSGNAGGVGGTCGVEVGATENAPPIELRLPQRDEVGVYSVADSTNAVTGRPVTNGKPPDRFGNYVRPTKGQLAWHVPVNSNFQQMSAEMKELARRTEQIEQLKQQVATLTERLEKLDE